jgi:O-acetylserine/cysteine efflux transporter
MTTHTRYSVYVLVSALIAAGALVLTEIAIQFYGVAPLLVIVLGNLVGGGVLLLASAGNRANLHPTRPGRDLAAVIAAALCIYTLAYLLSFNAIGRIGAGKTALLGQLETPFVVVLAIIFLGEQASAWRWLAGVLALTGALLINFDLQAWQLTLGWGEIQATLAPIGTATGIIILKPVLDRANAYRVTGLALVLGGLFLTPLIPVTISSAELGGAALGVIVLMGLLRGLAWLIYNTGLKHIGASRSAIIFISFAFFTVMLQAGVAKFEPMLGLQLPANLPAALIGGVLIALGIVILQTDRVQVGAEI